MSIISFIILFLFIKENNSYKTNINISSPTNPIESCISKTYYINYTNTDFIFDIKDNFQLQINIRSINCKINVFSSNNKGIESHNKELYHLILNSTNKKYQ